MTTRKAAEALDGAQALFDAIERHQGAVEAHEAARAERDEARKALVTLLHEHGVVGFSL